MVCAKFGVLWPPPSVTVEVEDKATTNRLYVSGIGALTAASSTLGCPRIARTRQSGSRVCLCRVKRHWRTNASRVRTRLEYWRPGMLCWRFHAERRRNVHVMHQPAQNFIILSTNGNETTVAAHLF
jgi:hypothetical protein